MTKYRDLLAGLKRGALLPLYLFWGEEALRIQEAVDLISEKAVEPGARDFNANTLYCRETAVTDLVALCQTLPLMSERRLVIAKEIDAFKAADLEELTAYLRDPSPTTCLVMLSSQRRYDKKAVVSAVEAGGGAATVFYPLLDREIVGWIEGRVRKRGLVITKDAAHLLWQGTGSDLQKLGNELEKVFLYVRERRTIGPSDITAVMGDLREFTSFDLAEAIGRKDAERALLVLTRLVQEGEQPVAILGSVAWNFRRLLRAKALEAAGTGFEEIKRKVGVVFHQSAKFQEQMRRFSREELREAFPVMLSADRMLKSSGLSGRLVLDRLVLRLCGGGG